MRSRVSNLMDEIWEKAVESALDGQTDHSSVQTLTLDGAVKCVHGRLQPPAIFEKFDNLHHLSIANIGVSSLEQFPALKNLQKLNLSDNRIAGGLNHLVEAGLESLRDLDLSNNRIQFIDDLAPLAQLRLLSLDLYESPVTRVKDYRARVFSLIKSLRFLDKMDVEGNERPESDYEDDDEDDEEEEDEGEEEDEEDPGSGEIDGDGDGVARLGGIVNGGHVVVDRDGVVDVDEDEESDADEEESEIVRNGSVVPDLLNQSNGFHVHALNNDAGEEEDEGDDDDDGEYEEDNDSGEEIDEDGAEADADVVEVNEILDSDEEEEDGVDEEDDEGSNEEVDNEEVNIVAAPYANGRLANAEGVIDGHEHGDDDEEDGEEEEEGVEDERDFDEEEEDGGAGYLVQPVGHVVEDATASDMDPVNDDEEDLEEEEIQDDDHHGRVELQVPSSSSHLKRKRDADADCDNDEDGNDDDSDDNDDDDNDGDGDGEDDII